MVWNYFSSAKLWNRVIAYRRGTVKQSHDYMFGILQNYLCWVLDI